MKAKAFAPVNVALIKYWGRVDEDLRLPTNASLSVNLNKMGTVTTVEWDKELKQDMADERMRRQLNRIRELAKISWRARVETENNFPAGTGLSSSASGLAALTLAGTAAAGLEMSQKDLSRLARLGSGSACRSMADGWVEWQTGTDQSSYGKTVFPVDYWDVRVLVVILSLKTKRVSSSEGQKLAKTSPFFEQRLKNVLVRMARIKAAIRARDFSQLGEIMEADCLEMHKVMQSQKPGLNYLLPATKRVMGRVRQWREEGLKSYFTVNTGQNVLVFCEAENELRLADKLKQVEGVIEVRREKIGKGARLLA